MFCYPFYNELNLAAPLQIPSTFAQRRAVVRGGVVRGSPNPKHFGLALRLRKALKQTGLTRRALARIAGVSDPLVGYLEADQRLPTVATITRLASALGVSAGWLAYGLGDIATAGTEPSQDSMSTRLQAVRVELQLTKAALARLIGISPSALAKIENGGQTGIDVLEALAQALGVSPGWLAFGVGPQVLPSRRRSRQQPQPEPEP